MPEFLKTAFIDGPAVSPLEVLTRLLVALVLGWLVAWIYRRTRQPNEIEASFSTTLVLLAILIAMVTQVIGDNIARAFSLVGALGIVRFRTIVRDTKDTAFVIFAVVVGMAVGAKDPWVAVIGIGVVGAAALVMMNRASPLSEAQPDYLLRLRVGIGHDVDKLVGGTLDTHLQRRDLVAIGTARQGVAVEVAYQTRLRSQDAAADLVKALNRIEGVQSVQLERRGFDPA